MPPRPATSDQRPSCGRLDDHCDPLSSADARRRESVALPAAAKLVQKCEQQTRSRRRERMSESDRAAVDVEFLLIDAELFDDREDLRRECLIDLDEIDVA